MIRDDDRSGTYKIQIEPDDEINAQVVLSNYQGLQ